ncbi:MAG: high-potential iron-sulfur protein [Rhizobiales bacterium]|nr:high-potential iron-sulfur protein [Rhizobacter sp.]
MSNPSRRAFVMTVVAGGSALAASRVSAQAAAPVLPETDPQAVALGYKADATKVDKAKYPQHAATQLCNNCNFYQGKATDAMAPCQLFAAKQVAGKGWCSAWVKKS